MSTANNQTPRKTNLNPEAMTFINDDVIKNANSAKMVDVSGSQLSEFEQQRRINELRKEAVFLYLPDDPAYRPISDDLISVNEMSKNLDGSTRVMINVALGDYGVFRKKPVSENDKPEQIKLNFRKIYFEDFDTYTEAQDELNDMNKRVLFLENSPTTSMQQLDELREYKKKAKLAINKKIDVGLKTFFKIPNGVDIAINKKAYDYNDLLLNIEVGVFRYTRAPFLRQISSTSSS